jgi:transcriptional regulator with XRE-family HTH domain
MSLGERVKERRSKLRMNQKQLADACGLTQATISRIESGKVNQLKSDAATRLAMVLGVTVDYLVGKTSKLTSDDSVESDPNARIIFRGYEKLSPEGKKQIKDFVRFLEAKEKREKDKQ